MYQYMKKSRFIAGLAALTGLAVSAGGLSVSAATAGDIDSDEKISIADYALLKNIILGNSESSVKSDINGDGNTDAADLLIMRDYMFGRRTSLPEIQENPPVNSSEKKITYTFASADVCIRGDGKPEDQSIINVAGFNAAVRRNVYIKFSASELDLSDVRRAEIELLLSNTANGNCEVKICPASDNWTENDPPEYVSSPDESGLLDVVVTKHNDDVGKIIKFDVTDYIRDNPGKKEYSFVLFCDHENNSDAVSNLALFYARESADSQIPAPKLVVESGGEKAQNAKAMKADETTVRFESSVKSGTFMRVSSGKLTSGRNISPLSDAKFTEKTGFAGNDTVSFESAASPGMYLCRKQGSSEIILAVNDGSEYFRKNASFVKTEGNSKGTSYQLYDQPGRWLSCVGQEYFVSSADTDQRKQNSSFMMRSYKNVIMSDDFEGNELNTNVWAYNYPWADHHNYSAVARKSQVAVRDGKLVLTATRVAADNWIKDDKGETGYTDKIGESKWRKYSHLTGVVHLPFSRYPLSGNLYMEGRFRMPDKSGFWPAFWLNGNNSWPPEIDIFEYLSNTPEKIYVGIHRQDSSRENGDGGAGWWITRTASFFQKEFHTYALDWGSTYINYYIDDVLVKSIEDKAYIDNQKNMYLIINLGVGGWAEEPTDNVGDNTTYECDYVHIYGY